MTTLEAVVSIVAALLLAGGPVTTFINARAARQEKLSTAQGESNVIDAIAEDLGMTREERWRDYADDIEKRMKIEMASLREAVNKARNSTDSAVAYIDVLRDHIYKQLPPPPPPWPDNLT